MFSTSQMMTLSIMDNADTSLVEKDQNSTSVVQLVLESSSLTVIMLGAILLNILTITIILRVRSLRQNPHNLLILNLSVADLGVALTSMTFSLVSVFDEGYFLITHDVICIMNGFFSILFSFTNFPIILGIATDRLLIVVFSRRFPPNRQRVYLMVVASWFFGIAIASSAAAGYLIDYKYDQSTKHCTRIWGNDIFRISCSVIYLGLTIPCLIAIYVIITHFIWKESLNLRNHGMHELSSSLSNIKAQTIDSNEDSGAISVSLQPEPNRRQADPPTDEGDMDTVTGERNGRKANVTALERKVKVQRQRQRHEAHKRVIIMGALLVFTSVICWTPYLVYHSYYIRVSEEGHSWLGVFTMWLGYCNALIDPLIYAFLNRRVRAELWRLKRKASACCTFPSCNRSTGN